MQHNKELNLLSSFKNKSPNSFKRMWCWRHQYVITCVVKNEQTSMPFATETRDFTPPLLWPPNSRDLSPVTATADVSHPHSWRQLPQDAFGWTSGRRCLIRSSSGPSSRCPRLTRTRSTLWTSAVVWSCWTDCLSLTVYCAVLVTLHFERCILDVHKIGNIFTSLSKVLFLADLLCCSYV